MRNKILQHVFSVVFYQTIFEIPNRQPVQQGASREALPYSLLSSLIVILLKKTLKIPRETIDLRSPLMGHIKGVLKLTQKSFKETAQKNANEDQRNMKSSAQWNPK